MGTNYYLETDVCEYCGRGDGDLHIGKSSAGWAFSLHVIPKEEYMEDDELVIENLDDWKKLLFADGAVIRNEYGEYITPDEMLDIITSRSGNLVTEEAFHGDGIYARLGWYSSLSEFLNRNHAWQDEKHGLLRAVADGRHCVGNGEGTWDLIQGEFS